VLEEGKNVYLQLGLDGSYSKQQTQLITTALLGKTKMAREAYENPDGSPLKIDTDYFGNKRSESNPSPGPFENPGVGVLKLKVW
jgi:alpha-L-arabinofuranosidase